MKKWVLLCCAASTVTISAAGAVPPIETRAPSGPDQECGTCVPYVKANPEDPDLHKFNAADSTNLTHKCAGPGGGGHPTHNCVTGDGTQWAPGECSVHADCGGSFAMGLLHEAETSMTWLRAASLAQLHEDLELDPSGSRLLVRGCNEAIIAVIPVESKATPLPLEVPLTSWITQAFE